MRNVLIADDRPKWMQKEDKIMTCMHRCLFFKQCSTRIGTDCKKLGGSEIPKIRGGYIGKEKSSHYKS